MEGPAENPGINRRALSAIFAKAAKAPEALECVPVAARRLV